MHISQLKESKFLTKEDVGAGMVVTIQDCRQENVARKEDPPELKWVLDFAEVEKPLVLNSINGQLIAQITGSEESDGWIGCQIGLYVDHTVAYGGKLMGGIRVCPPGNPPQQQAPRQQPMQRRPVQGQPMQGRQMQQGGAMPGGVRQARPFQPQQQYQPPMQQGMNMPPADIPTDDDVNYS